MSDYNERACTNCGCLLHHEDDCPTPKPLIMDKQNTMPSIEDVQNKHGFHNGCSLHSNPEEIKKSLDAAMEEYANLKLQDKQGGWVKASDRLPNEYGNVHWRSAEDKLPILVGVAYSLIHLKGKPNKVEWLDESLLTCPYCAEKDKEIDELKTQIQKYKDENMLGKVLMQSETICKLREGLEDMILGQHIIVNFPDKESQSKYNEALITAKKLLSETK